MRYLILVIGLLSSVAPALGAGPKNSCMDPEINRQWQKVQKQFSKDPLVLKLSSLRGALCGMIAGKQIDVETARSIWDQALVNALLERAREEQQRRGLLRLFGTF